MDGSGTGKLNGKQVFVCRANFALFRPIESVIPEKDFLVGRPKNITDLMTTDRVNRQGQHRKLKMRARSMSYSSDTSGKVCIYLSVFLTPSVLYLSVCSTLYLLEQRIPEII